MVLSRSSRPNAGAESLLADMALRGCSVRHLQCDITRKADVESAISQVSAWGPIKGIIHTAVSLEVSRIRVAIIVNAYIRNRTSSSALFRSLSGNAALPSRLTEQ